VVFFPHAHGRRWPALAVLVLALLLQPPGGWGQAERINSHLIIVGATNFCVVSSGSGTAYACDLALSPLQYTLGARYTFQADVANTGPATLNVHSLGAKAIVKLVGGSTTPLAPNDLRVGQMVDVIYDGTNLQMLSQLGTGVVASGTLALATAAIASGTCTSAQTAAATGTLTTDVVLAAFNGDVTAVTGYTPSTAGTLRIDAYPTANTVNFKVCNHTATSITPGVVTLNWRVLR
jgi:hypothetical protein